MPYLSIVIPAYNEEKRIGKTLFRIWDYMAGKEYEYEVIVVDDGSMDGTISEVQKSRLAIECKLKMIKNGANRGKGFSVRNGISNSRGDYILFSDADLSTPIEELDKLFSIMDQGYDAVIGSRALKDSNVKVRQLWYREMMGKTFNLFVKSVLMGDFRDTQCGFKLFKASVAKEAVSVMKIDGFSFDVELLYLLLKKGYKIKEVPVVWLNSPVSKVNPLFDSLRMLIELMKIKKIHR